MVTDCIDYHIAEPHGAQIKRLELVELNAVIGRSKNIKM